MKSKQLISLLSILFFIMLGTTLWASSQQNLFTEFSWTGSAVWFKATLIDFYINQFIIWLLVVYLEKNNFMKAIWFLMFFCLGSMGTCLYLVLSIYKNNNLLQRIIQND